MRGIILLAALSATLAHGAANDYVEVRDLRLDAGGISELEIDAGAGSLDVVGDAGIDAIVVTATITVPDEREEKALEVIASDMVLTLEQQGDDLGMSLGRRDHHGRPVEMTDDVRVRSGVQAQYMASVVSVSLQTSSSSSSKM